MGHLFVTWTQKERRKKKKKKKKRIPPISLFAK